MNLASVTKQVITEVETILDNSGLVNVKVAKAKDKRIRYSLNRMEELDFAGKDTTVVYSIESLNTIGRADNRNAMRQARVSIDVFTYNDETDEELLDLIEKIEEESDKLGYRMDMEYAGTFNSTRQSMMLSYLLTKNIH